MSHITSTERFAKAGPYTYTYPMKNTLIGYARCSTDTQDLSAQGQALFNLGVSEDNIYTDHGLTGTSRDRPAWIRPSLPCVRGIHWSCQSSIVSPGRFPMPGRLQNSLR